MGQADRRSSLATAIGVGSAKSGLAPWWAERVTALALAPLTAWFVVALITHAHASRSAFVAWLGQPLPSVLMILLLVALFRHTALGLQVVIEDYVHSRIKFAAIVAVQFACFAAAAVGILADLRIAFGR